MVTFKGILTITNHILYYIVVIVFVYVLVPKPHIRLNRLAAEALCLGGSDDHVFESDCCMTEPYNVLTLCAYAYVRKHSIHAERNHFSKTAEIRPELSS